MKRFTTLAQIENYLYQQDRGRNNYYTVERMHQAIQRLQHPEL